MIHGHAVSDVMRPASRRRPLQAREVAVMKIVRTGSQVGPRFGPQSFANLGRRFPRNASTPSANSALPNAIAWPTASRSKKSSTLAS